MSYRHASSRSTEAGGDQGGARCRRTLQPHHISFGAHVVIANTLALQEGGVTRQPPSIKQDELDETVEHYHELGMRICTHAIGDIAMDMILEA